MFLHGLRTFNALSVGFNEKTVVWGEPISRPLDLRGKAVKSPSKYVTIEKTLNPDLKEYAYYDAIFAPWRAAVLMRAEAAVSAGKYVVIEIPPPAIA